MNSIAKPIYRILSGLIDIVIFKLPFVYSLYWLSIAKDFENILNRFWSFVIIILIYGLIVSFINSFLISILGGTIGNLLAGTTIVSSQQTKISFWRAFFRNHVGQIVSSVLLWLGFIWIFIDKDKRGWHDMIADTYVVVTNKSMYIFGVLFLIVSTWLNVFLINSTIINFKNNADIYIELLNSITND